MVGNRFECSLRPVLGVLERESQAQCTCTVSAVQDLRPRSALAGNVEPDVYGNDRLDDGLSKVNLYDS